MSLLLSVICAGAGSLMVCFWGVLFLRAGSKYDGIIQAVDRKQFQMPEIFMVGFCCIDWFKINLKTVAGRKKEKELAELYGDQYAGFYRYVIVGGQISYAITLIPIALFMGVLSDSLPFTFLILLGAAAIIVYLDLDIKNNVGRKRDEILEDYPEVLSQLTLLVNAGMIVREAWDKVAYNSNRALYKEMQTTSLEMQNGISESEALYNFAQRCSVKEIRKFSSLLIQNLKKGGSELTASLRLMTTESWEEKKQLAVRKGEAASQKLLIPLIIMFIGIIIMIIVPVFSSIV